MNFRPAHSNIVLKYSSQSLLEEAARREGALTLLLRCRVRVTVTVGNGVGTNSGRSGGLMRALNLNPWHTRSFNRR
jgi:hypothetical protein